MICPVHQTEMKQGTYGPYCTSFVGIGAQGANAKGYCNYRPPKPAAPTPAAPGNGPRPQNPNKDRLIFAQTAMKCAAEMFAGTGTTNAAELWACRLYRAFLDVEAGQPLHFPSPQFTGPATQPAGREPGDDEPWDRP